MTSEETEKQGKPRVKCGGGGHYNHSSRGSVGGAGAPTNNISELLGDSSGCFLQSL